MDKEWTLKWSGCKDSPMTQASAKHCSIYPLYKDSKAHLITHEEYIKLVEDKEIAEAQSYWQIKEGQVGLVTLSSYDRYITTWDAISLCKCDFEDGWKACEKNK